MTHDWSWLAISPPVWIGAGMLLAAAVHDLIARTVPNWMALAVVGLGLVARVLDNQVVAGLTACVIVFVCAAILWRRGWMGGGDVKLIAAASLLVPPGSVLRFIADMALAGAVLAMIYLVARKLVPEPHRPRPQFLLARAFRAEQWRINRGCPLPYACAIASGFLFVTF